MYCITITASVHVLQIAGVLWCVIPIREIEIMEEMPEGGSLQSAFVISTYSKVCPVIIRLYLCATDNFSRLKNSVIFASIENRKQFINRVKELLKDIKKSK